MGVHGRIAEKGGAGRRLELLDTTLRDGAQARGISFSVEDKLKIVKCLDDFGIAYIEAGNPASNVKDAELFRRLAGVRLNSAKLVAFGSTRRAGAASPGGDAGLAALAGACAPYASIFGKCWDYHVREILKTSNAENLSMISESVAYLIASGKRVIFDAEHFFDGYAANPEYAMACLDAAYGAGAETLCLCDTNGGAFPLAVRGAARAAVRRFGAARIGIHCHNDGGMAVANTMVAIQAGAAHAQGTVNGYGERCGNADLCAIIANAQLKLGRRCVEDGKLQELTLLSRTVSEICNIPHDEKAPYVGANAFAHKGGMHIDAVEKSPPSFEHVDPEQVGNSRSLLMSEVSGRSNVARRVRKIAPEVTKAARIAADVAARLKQLEADGYQFEGAEASFELEIKKMLGTYRQFFELVSFKVFVGEPAVDGAGTAAWIKIRVGGQEYITAGEGEGPVHALDSAIRKSVTHFYPQIAGMKLTDYKVRVIDSDAATAAKVRVLIESTDGRDSWATVGVSSDIILASWKALVDSIEYMLMRAGAPWPGGAGEAAGSAEVGAPGPN
ncbi:MAG: citramalate synthase [Clostridiales bacterium]|jgi:2-isopropylmalate synthase|nr:citramalate synthase [Clostridiales bacterium]